MRVLTVIVLVCALLGIGCSENRTVGAEDSGIPLDAMVADKTVPPKVCTPGLTQPCTCPGGTSGIQTCAKDGKSWGNCGGCSTSADGGLDAFPPDKNAGVPGTWITIPAGTFKMGSPITDKCRISDEPEQIPVTLSNKFEIQTTEVTQDQFQAVMGYKPWWSKSCSGTCPVETVSWYEAVAYCNALSTNKGLTQCYACTSSGKNVTCKETAATTGKGIYTSKGYRLPTEAEWEYAYRAGTTTAFYSGGITSCQSKDPNADKIGWYQKNSGKTVHPASQKTPNAWGLYDMAGNVEEWCHDGYQKNLGSSAQTDPVGSGKYRVLRGGSWDYPSNYLRAAKRHDHSPTNRNSVIGFRCSRTLP